MYCTLVWAFGALTEKEGRPRRKLTASREGEEVHPTKKNTYRESTIRMNRYQELVGISSHRNARVRCTLGGFYCGRS